MRGHHVPNAFLVISLTPLERTGSAHEGFEEFGVVARVQNDKTHSFKDALFGALDNFVLNVPMGHMPPPQEHIRLIKNGLAETVLRLVESRRAHLETGFLPKEGCDRLVHALRIDRGNLVTLFFMAKLAPNGNVKRSRHTNFPL